MTRDGVPPLALRQVIETAWPGDAITSMALAIDSRLAGPVRGEIYAWGIHPELAGRVTPVQELPAPHVGDVLVYHLSIGTPQLTKILLNRAEPMVLAYHNVTPPELLIDHPDLALRCHWGRLELELLRHHVRGSLADSEYNAAELRRLGYEPVVTPLGADPHRLLGRNTRGLAEAERARLGPRYALVVAQALPHKRIERVLQALHLIQHVMGRQLGLAVVGHERDDAYASALRSFAEVLDLRDVWFPGRVEDELLAALYDEASVLVSASQHEGLGLPLWEAMAFGTPVVAVGHAAVPETVGDAGLVLPEAADAAELAEAVLAVLDDPDLAQSLTAAGRRRVSDIDPDASAGALLSLVEQLV